MATYQQRLLCVNCAKHTLHAKTSFSDGLGCALSVLSFGLFLPVWLALNLWWRFRVPYRCQTCGYEKQV